MQTCAFSVYLHDLNIMNKSVLALICCLLCGPSLGREDPSQNQSLVLLHVLFRHGDRNPLEQPGPNDPYRNESYWPGGLGSLNNAGKMRMYLLGKYLRERYGYFIGPYSDTTVIVRSTDVLRSLMSVECVLAGLFQPQGDQIWNQNLLWQPIPIHTVPVKEDRLLHTDAECLAYVQDQDSFIYGPEVLELMQRNVSKLERFQEMTGTPKATIINIGNFIDTINIEVENNMTLPSWVYEFYPEWTSTFSDLMYQNIWTYTTRMRNIRCGPMFKEWQTHIHQLQKGELNGLRFFTYSAHDFNIIELLQCMGYTTTPSIPAYGSSLMMEVHKSYPQGYHVRILFRNGTDSVPQILSPMGCGPECPVGQFISNLYSNTPENWDYACFGGQIDVTRSSDYMAMILTGLSYLGVITFALGLIFCAWTARPTKSKRIKATYETL